MSPELRIIQLGLELPVPSRPAGNYAAAVRSGSLLFLSGKAPLPELGVYPRGRLGEEFSAEDGYRLARSACTDLLAATKAAIGSLDEVEQILEVHGSLNTTPDFADHARVLDGASDLLVALFGPAGMHVRSVIVAKRRPIDREGNHPVQTIVIATFVARVFIRPTAHLRRAAFRQRPIWTSLTC